MLKYAKFEKKYLHHLAKHIFVMFRNKTSVSEAKLFIQKSFRKLTSKLSPKYKSFLVFRNSVLKNFSKTTLLKLRVELKIRPLQCLIAILI